MGHNARAGAWSLLKGYDMGNSPLSRSSPRQGQTNRATSRALIYKPKSAGYLNLRGVIVIVPPSH